ncbi:unnamed protein product [Lepeophtheirus salmonis]|uniref:(salmon louse) hypothetical protein n=1 Tax=Lepeophtheirus salmonis TaxID=72036 RepID=A0A7R8CU78_LEPSM|nr:unnamed protein product [Lepeophtheirus salmonis]CAF2934190.1 unnamed protein product [Lepeophtheirus salmonis]
MDEIEFLSKNLKVSLGFSSIGALFITICFFSPYWLQSFPSERVPNPKFTNLGLWEVCFDGFHDMRHQYDTRFYGCKHILLEEYAIIQHEIQPRKNEQIFDD